MSFVNYTPSKERTDHNTNEAIMKYGKDIVIINGEDNWNACKIFHISTLLNKFGIEKVGDFHDGISGLSNSGCIIKKKQIMPNSLKSSINGSGHCVEQLVLDKWPSLKESKFLILKLMNGSSSLK